MLHRRQRRQTQFDATQRRHGIRHNHRQVVGQIDFHLVAQRRALDELQQRLAREHALNDHRRIGGTMHKFGISVRLGTINGRTGEIAFTRKDQVRIDGSDFDPVRYRVHVATNLGEIVAGQIDDRAIDNVGHDQLFRIRLQQPQFLTVALPDVAIVVLETEMRDDPVVVIAVLNVHGEGIIVGHGRNDLEQMQGIGANHNLVRLALVLFKLVGIEHDIDQNGMGLVEVDDPNALFGKRNGRIRQNVFDGRNNVSYGLNLDRFDGQYIVVFVHSYYPTSNRIV